MPLPTTQSAQQQDSSQDGEQQQGAAGAAGGKSSHHGHDSRGGGAPDPDGGGQDVRPYLRQFGEQLGGLRKENQRLQQEHRSTAETLGKIRQVFSPEEARQQTPFDGDEEMVDHYLETAMEAQRNGGDGLPLTTNLAVKLVESRKIIKETQEQMTKLAEQVKALQNPALEQDRRACLAMDTEVSKGLTQIFGTADKHRKEAVAGAITEEIIRLQQNPKTRHLWERIRTSPEDQRAMVNYFIEKVTVPPRAKALMEEEHLRTTPMSQADLYQAFHEAKQIENPKERDRIMTRIRQEILASNYSEKRNQTRQQRGFRVG